MIGFPVFSYGTYPAGPKRLDSRDPNALNTARVGDLLVTKEDVVFADADKNVFMFDTLHLVHLYF